MSITVNGRLLQVILKNNTGDVDVDGTELDISNLLLTLGDINWSVDENLTKLSVGNLSLTCTDDNSNTLQNFIESNITSANGLLPPWLFLYVDGNLTFTGLIFESPTITQEASNLTIDISAINWATMLTYKYIKAGDLSFSRLNDFRKGLAYVAGPTIPCYSTYNKELQRGHYLNMVVVDNSYLGQFNVGDWVYVNNYDVYLIYNKKYQIVNIQNQSVGGLYGPNTLCLWLGSGFNWQTAGLRNYGQQSTLFRVYQTTSNVTDTVTNLPKFVSGETWPVTGITQTSKYSIHLTYTDGLQAGDVLNLIVSGNTNSASINITDVDNINNNIYLDQAINFNLTSNVTSFELSLDSLDQAILQPLMPIIDKALIGVASSDFTSFAPTTVPSPALSFISPSSYYGQNTNTERLTGVSWIQPTLTDFEISGPTTPNTLSWHGLPATGWTAEATNSFVSVEPWTKHIQTAPIYLLPSLPTPSDGIADPERIKGGMHDPNQLDIPQQNLPYYRFVYDYTSLRGFTFRFLGGICTNASYQTFNGTSWSTANVLSTSGIGVPRYILPLYGSSSSLGTGCGLVASYSDGTVKTLFTSTAQSSISLPPDAWVTNVKSNNNSTTSLITYLVAGLTLTSNGIYYSTPSGYGLITVSSGVLSQSYCNLFGVQSKTNIASSIISVAPIINCMVYANGEIEALTNITYQTGGTGQPITDTYLLQLNKTPQSTALLSCNKASFICHSLPRTGMMVKSPVSEDVLGFLSSRLFIISKTLPSVIERFTPTSQTAQSLIEFICTITNSIASPLISGKLKIISRSFVKTPVNLNIDMVSIKESRWNKHMANTFVIKGDNNSLGVAVSSTQLAGLTVSYQNTEWIKNSSQAQAIAESYLAFFEKPRHEVEQDWFSAIYPAPWESLEPFDVITVNGGSTQYLLTSLSYNLNDQTAKATLLELL